MRSQLHTYAAGAVLIELLSEKSIRVGEKGKLEIIQDNKHNCHGNEAASIMLYKLEQTSTKTMKKWIQHLYLWRNTALSKDRVIQRIRAELIEEGPVTQQTALLTMILEVTKLLKGYFSAYEENELKKRLQRL